MAQPVEVRDAQAALKTFLGYLDDLERAPFDAATTKLRLVMNFAQKDPVARLLAERFRIDLPSADFLERVTGQFDVPAGRRLRLAFVFDLLLNLKTGWKLNLRELLTRDEFGGGDLDARWARFGAQLVTPWREDLERIHAWLGGRPPQQYADAGALFAEALEALFGAVADGDAAPSAPAPVAASAAPARSTPGWDTPALTALAGALEGAPGRADLEVDARLLQLELRKERPAAARLDELLADLGAAGAEVLAAARACLPDAATQGPGPAPADAPSAPEVAPGGAPGPADDVGALAAERGALESERRALAAEREALAAEREALEAERRAFEAERSPGA